MYKTWDSRGTGDLVKTCTLLCRWICRYVILDILTSSALTFLASFASRNLLNITNISLLRTWRLLQTFPWVYRERNAIFSGVFYILTLETAIPWRISPVDLVPSSFGRPPNWYSHIQTARCQDSLVADFPSVATYVLPRLEGEAQGLTTRHLFPLSHLILGGFWLFWLCHLIAVCESLVWTPRETRSRWNSFI